jgi:hypothetical protein
MNTAGRVSLAAFLAAIFLFAVAASGVGGADSEEDFASLAAPPAGVYPCSGKVMLVVNSNLYSQISDSLAVYKKDLEREGYTVGIDQWSGGTNKTFQSHLRSLWNTQRFVGAVLIGELPVPWLEAGCWDDTIPDWAYGDDAPYADMDGQWLDQDNDGNWNSVGRFLSAMPEVWIGRIYAGNLDSLVSEAYAVNNYFSRLHQYRLGNIVRDSRSLGFVNFEENGCDQYGRIPALDSIYDITSCVGHSSAPANNEEAFLDSVSHGNFEFLHVVSHGGHAYPDTLGGAYCFSDPNWDRFTCYDDVTYYEIQEVGQRALFIHQYSCGQARWWQDNNLAGYYVFGNTSGLGFWSSTDGAFTGSKGFYSSLVQRKSFGEAVLTQCRNNYLSWPGFPLDTLPYMFCDEVFYGAPNINTVLLGDPTLTLRKTWHVNPAGSGITPTIQSAIDGAMYYDRIVLAPGTYTGTGNYNVDFKGKPVVVEKEYDTSTVVIDCQGNGRAFYFHSNETAGSKVIGLTIKRGYVQDHGGGILCKYGASPEIIDCFFDSCRAARTGGAIAMWDSCKTLVKGCTIVRGSAGTLGNIYIANTAVPLIKNCLIAYSRTGSGVYYAGSNSSIMGCCDVYGNFPANYGSFSNFPTNISANPMFCDTTSGDFRVNYSSPCLPINNSCHVLIGSTKHGCPNRLCGDANGDGAVDISDAIYVIEFVFFNGPAPSPLSIADVDCTGLVDVSDALYIIDYVNAIGPAPCAACK